MKVEIIPKGREVRLKKRNLYLFCSLIFVFCAFFITTGYCIEQIHFLGVRHSSYPDEQKTRVAFDFSGGFPQLNRNMNPDKKEIRIIFENIRASREMLKTYSVDDERVEKITIKKVEKGTEAVIVLKVPCEVESGNVKNSVKNSNTTIYFDIYQKNPPENTSEVQLNNQIGFGKVMGKIFDNLNGKTIQGVKVVILEGNQGTISDEDGMYVLFDIPSGTVTLEFSHPGYKTEKRDISIIKDQETNFNIALNRDVTASLAISPSETLSPLPSINRFQNQEALEFFQLGEYHFQSNHFAEAIVAYQKAIEYDPEFADAYYKLGISLGKSGRSEDGVLALEKAIQLNPQNASAYNALGAIYGMLEKYDLAIEFFKKAVGIDSQLSLAYNNLGILYGKIGEHQKAIEALKQAIQIDPLSAESQGALGVAYAMAGQPQNAVKQLEEAIRLDPSYVKAYFNLGITYLWLGDIRRARDQYESLQNLDQEMAQELLKELQKVEK